MGRGGGGGCGGCGGGGRRGVERSTRARHSSGAPAPSEESSRGAFCGSGRSRRRTTMMAAAQARLLAHAARLSPRPSPVTAAAAAAVALGCKGRRRLRLACRAASSSSPGGLEAPNLAALCEKARLHLTPEEIADFTPKIASVVDWFSQLQDVDVENVAPAIRVGEVEGESTLRADVPAVFEGREAMLAAAPELEGPYLKVPRILKENTE